MATYGMAKRELELGGKYLGTLRDANDLRDDIQALHALMEEDGYLLIRSFHDRAKVEAARRALVEDLDAAGQIDRRYPIMDAVVAEGARGTFASGWKQARRMPAFLNLVESPEIMEFFARFLGGPTATFDYKWLRVIGPGGYTGAHYDVVYMGRGTRNLYTVWTPIGDVTLDMGPLAILVGSHRFERIKATYGQMDVDRDNTEGWFSTDPIELVDRYGGQWRTTEFQMGDAILFGMFTMHASLNNVSNRFRITCDTRYQRADEPMDERWVGRDPIMHDAAKQGEFVPMTEARKRWGV
ncbi:MAG TPA: phytanoyl-CoA dioxygenase family protein [Chthonomonadaceae bacterium]|nr:phytanoyl-CoA dioxygenase family protein [Chthonomonadaceae bacterium]